jgi:hypothetical protein
MANLVFGFVMFFTSLSPILPPGVGIWPRRRLQCYSLHGLLVMNSKLTGRARIGRRGGKILAW